jgi:hypothetical protein
VISAAENSNKFQKTRFWKEKSVEDVVTLGPRAQARLVHTMLTRGCVSHSGLAIYIKRILGQKKYYENSNISPCKSIILKKFSKRNQNPSRYYNSIIIPKFQNMPKYHLSKIFI